MAAGICSQTKRGRHTGRKKTNAAGSEAPSSQHRPTTSAHAPQHERNHRVQIPWRLQQHRLRHQMVPTPAGVVDDTRETIARKATDKDHALRSRDTAHQPHAQGVRFNAHCQDPGTNIWHSCGPGLNEGYTQSSSSHPKRHPSTNGVSTSPGPCRRAEPVGTKQRKQQRASAEVDASSAHTWSTRRVSAEQPARFGEVQVTPQAPVSL